MLEDQDIPRRFLLGLALTLAGGSTLVRLRFKRSVMEVNAA